MNLTAEDSAGTFDQQLLAVTSEQSLAQVLGEVEEDVA